AQDFNDSLRANAQVEPSALVDVVGNYANLLSCIHQVVGRARCPSGGLSAWSAAVRSVRSASSVAGSLIRVDNSSYARTGRESPRQAQTTATEIATTLGHKMATRTSPKTIRPTRNMIPASAVPSTRRLVMAAPTVLLMRSAPATARPVLPAPPLGRCLSIR